MADLSASLDHGDTVTAVVENLRSGGTHEWLEFRDKVLSSRGFNLRIYGEPGLAEHIANAIAEFRVAHAAEKAAAAKEAAE